MVKDSLSCLGLPSNFPFGVTTLNALLDSPAGVAPPERGAPDSLNSFSSPALEGATLAGRTRPLAGELEGGGSCRDLTVMLKSRGIGAETDTSIAVIRVQIAKGNSVLCSDYHIIFTYLRLLNSSTIIRLLGLVPLNVLLNDDASTPDITRMTEMYSEQLKNKLIRPVLPVYIHTALTFLNFLNLFSWCSAFCYVVTVRKCVFFFSKLTPYVSDSR